MSDLAKPKRGRKQIDLERLRCLRHGDLLRLYRHRWGALLPDDDSGRADLFEILCVTSLALNAPEEKMPHVIETLAPWMKADEAQAEIDHIQCLPIFERTRTARHLGDNMRLLNAEREALHLWRLLPIDMTDDQLAEQRKAKSRKRREAKRRASGVRTKAEYLAELASRPKPWLAEGIHRRTWERRRAAGCVPSSQQTPQASDATILCKAVTHAAALPRAETQRRGLQERGEAKMLSEATKVEKVERQEPRGPYEHGTHLAATAENELLIALNNWGKNAEKKNSTSSRNKIERG